MLMQFSSWVEHFFSLMLILRGGGLIDMNKNELKCNCKHVIIVVGGNPWKPFCTTQKLLNYNKQLYFSFLSFVIHTLVQTHTDTNNFKIIIQHNSWILVTCFHRQYKQIWKYTAHYWKNTSTNSMSLFFIPAFPSLNSFLSNQLDWCLLVEDTDICVKAI